MQSIVGICAELVRLTEDQPTLNLLFRMASVEVRRAIPLRSFGTLNPNLPLRRIGVGDWDIKNDRNYGDPDLAELFGVDPSDVARGLPVGSYVNSVHPDDAHEVIQAIHGTLDNGGVYSSIYRVLDKRAQTHTVFAKGLCTIGSDKRPERFIGTVIDITIGRDLASIQQLAPWA